MNVIEFSENVQNWINETERFLYVFSTRGCLLSIKSDGAFFLNCIKKKYFLNRTT